MWNPSLTLPVTVAQGFGLNIAPDRLTDEAAPYRVEPLSPTCVWAGDPGIPQQITVTAEDGTTSSVPNPAWTADSPTFSTVFLVFPDEATAKACLPELWSDDA